MQCEVMPPLPYFYDPAEHRIKHCSAEPLASFDENGSGVISKCPSTLSKVDAQALLQNGVPDMDDLQDGHPKRIYAVYDGVVYQAVPTILGKSYHGYPWRGRPGHNRLPRFVKRELERRASEQGCLKKFKDWMKQYES